jgi:hypothetical protein
LENYMLVTQRGGPPVPLEHFITGRMGMGLPMSSHDRTAGAKFFEELRQHAAAMHLRRGES